MCPSIPLSTSGTQGAVKKEKRPCITNIATASDIKVSNRIIIRQWFHSEGIGGNQADTILNTKQKTIRYISYDIGYNVIYDIDYDIVLDIVVSLQRRSAVKVPVKVPVKGYRILGTI